MFRKLSLALAVTAALSSAGVYALGLGEIVTKSALNENFSADIALLDINPEDIDGIKASLAPAAAFSRAGLDRPFFLSRLRFQPLVLDDGSPVVRITTRQPVREPFLNFLLEVDWPKGRLIREYTVLLDPPVTLDRRPPPVEAPVIGVSQQIPRQRAPARKTADEPRIASAPGDTLVVRRGDTLWGIAERLDFPGATTYQVVMALYKENPQAFGGGDINKLMAAAELRIPLREGVLASGAAQAHREFRAVSSAPGRPTTPPPSHLRIATPMPEEEPGDTGGGDMERVKTDLMMVRETSESTRQETDELRARIQELEAQLADIRSLLKLKSDELALLQAGGAEEQGAATPTLSGQALQGRGEEGAAVEPVVTPGTAATGQPPAAGPEPAQPVVTREPQPAAGPSAPVAKAPVAEAPVPAAEPAPKPAPRPAPKPEKVAEPGMLEGLLGNTTLLGIGGGVAVVLLSLIWLLMRRRRSAEDEFQESVLLAPGESSSTVDLEQEREQDLGPRGEPSDETSFISDFSPSDIDELQEETGEVDPAAEADVYIAYGRYQQAESLIQQAIGKSPDRLDLKLKLLEIYFTTRSVSPFVTLAEELEAAGAARQDPVLWERVQSLGRELVPGHELFGSEAAGETSPAAVPETEADGEPVLSDGEMLDGLDLDTDLSELPEPSRGGASESMDLGGGSELEPPRRGGAPAGSTAGEMQEGDSEFALDLGDLSSLEDIDLGGLKDEDTEPTAGFGGSSAGSEPDQEIAPLELDQEVSVPEIAEHEEEEIPAISLDELDMGGDLMVGEDSQGLSDSQSGDWSEEIETKLDLARAYQEMGDSDGAREILDEVLKEGSEAQQKTAKEIMEQLG